MLSDETIQSIAEAIGPEDNDPNWLPIGSAHRAVCAIAASKEVRALVDALQFYADKNNHLPQNAFRAPYSNRYMSIIEVNDDNGARARNALAPFLVDSGENVGVEFPHE